MTNSQIVELLLKNRQRIAFDANVQRIYHVDTPYAIRCLKEYERLTQEIERLQQPQQVAMPYA